MKNFTCIAESANRPENIAKGFTKTRTLQKTIELYDRLQNHPIVLRGKSYLDIPSHIRKGGTHRPPGRGNYLSIHFQAMPALSW